MEGGGREGKVDRLNEWLFVLTLKCCLRSVLGRCLKVNVELMSHQRHFSINKLPHTEGLVTFLFSTKY